MSLSSRYADFLLENAGRISAMESTLRTATYFLPGRFSDAELAGEAVYALLHLLGLYHDSILYRALEGRSALPPESAHHRYIRYMARTAPAYGALAKALTLIHSTEILVEMVALRRWGKRGKWKMVLYLELVKAALRLGLMRATNGRTVVRPLIPEREVEPSTLQGVHLARHDPGLANGGRDGQAVGKGHANGQANGHANGNGHDLKEATPLMPSSTTWRGKRSRGAHATLASLAPPKPPTAPPNAPTPSLRLADVNTFLHSRALTTQDVLRPGQLVRRLHGLGKMAELVWILRPLIYVAMIRRYGPRHPYPFALSLALEILSRRLYRSYLDLHVAKPAPLAGAGPGLDLGNDPLLGLLAGLGTPRAKALETEVEKDEMTQRGRALWLYLLRGPVWNMWTKQWVNSIIGGLEGKPVLGLVGSIAKDYLPLYDNYYYYSKSTSFGVHGSRSRRGRLTLQGVQDGARWGKVDGDSVDDEALVKPLADHGLERDGEEEEHPDSTCGRTPKGRLLHGRFHQHAHRLDHEAPHGRVRRLSVDGKHCSVMHQATRHKGAQGKSPTSWEDRRRGPSGKTASRPDKDATKELVPAPTPKGPDGICAREPGQWKGLNLGRVPSIERDGSTFVGHKDELDGRGRRQTKDEDVL